MTVHFIGVGPGAADLITVRGLNLLRQCPVVLYAGSLVPVDVLSAAHVDARCINTASLTLNEIMTMMVTAHTGGQNVARLHSGDPSLYGAIAEQMRQLAVLAIPYTVTPGVPAFAAAAAALETALTLPGISQTVILTRTAVRTDPMPPGEALVNLGKSQATLVIHLSINNLAAVVHDLTPLYGVDCPVAVVHRASWPDQRVLRGTLSDIRDRVKAAGFLRTALILVGRTLGTNDFRDSRLYAPDHSHSQRVF
ncbi:Cobalt-precorrin-4 C11-methyltransferase [invertebrate metagenome]|uniref:Cobalt-precorrin-4 C11-methyltransferase n=1 Tax=invertebrate metagenome TaxID=1711999 RepID=A0A484H6Z4_9ZZZZ